VVEVELLRVSQVVAARMRAAGLLGKTVTLNLRFANFTEVSRSLTLPGFTDLTGEIHQAALAIFAAMRLTRPRIRRVSIRMGGLRPKESVSIQPALGEPARGWREAERAADKAILRFGPGKVSRAALVR
ncbi:MAG: DNA polymerase IV, partial [Propionibacteriaceae bacterium]|jgi:DNA polymerase-4|nr:DNA polymerase IV [Propionibacteriaceae bacterium]